MVLKSAIGLARPWLKFRKTNIFYSIKNNSNIDWYVQLPTTITQKIWVINSLKENYGYNGSHCSFLVPEKSNQYNYGIWNSKINNKLFKNTKILSIFFVTLLVALQLHAERTLRTLLTFFQTPVFLPLKYLPLALVF